MATTVSPHSAIDSGGGPVDPERSILPASRTRRVPLLLLAVALVFLGAAVDEWLSGRLDGNWHVEFIAAGLLFAATAALAGGLLARSWRELRSAEQLLASATGNLTAAYESVLSANRELRATAEARDEALVRLRTAVRERETFLASVSHDLKSPLTVIKGHAELLSAHAQRAATVDRQRLQDGLDRIVAGATQMTKMVDDLLWLARLEMDQPLPEERRPTDLVALAQRAAADLGAVAPRHRVRLSLDQPKVIGLWDPTRIDRVIANLLSNAAKYSPEGSEISVSVGTEAMGATAVLTVSDRGIGIPAEDLPRVFESFYRAENAGENVVGTGMGLAGVRHAVEAHGGTVTVESSVGVGSTFAVRLPCFPPREAIVDDQRQLAAIPAPEDA